MDNAIIIPKMLSGTVTVPPSKSVAHRALIAAALSGGECIIDNLALSEDILATLGGIYALGSKYRYNKNTMRAVISPRRTALKSESGEIDCKESGSTLKLLLPIALSRGGKYKFTGQGRLLQRPIKPYLDMFAKKNILCETKADGIYVSGKLKGGRFELAGNVSSQFISGLLMALPLVEGDSEIVITTPPESRGYIDITLGVLKDFGIEIENRDYKKYLIRGNQSYKARNYTIEGDYSQGAFFLVAGALGCRVELSGLPKETYQGDKAILDIIKGAGGIIYEKDGKISVKRAETMQGRVIDARDIPDLVPILAVLLCFCKGESKIINAGRLRMKGSDSLSALTQELKRLGADITAGSDSLKIVGKQTLCGNTVSAWNDHRIAMALAIASCRCEAEQICILGGEAAVRKSYPDFFEVYNKLTED